MLTGGLTLMLASAAFAVGLALSDAPLRALIPQIALMYVGSVLAVCGAIVGGK
jgi:hypothetical protein